MNHEMRVKASRILVVDDVIANVSLLENVLHRFGYKHVRSVTDAREVFALVEEWRPDVILLDLAMPYLDGFEVMEMFRAQVPKEDWIPILVLTAHSDPKTKRKALAAGATEFLAKPFDSSEIVLRLRNLLLMRILHSELKNQNQVLEDHVAARTQALRQQTEQLEQTVAELKQTQEQLMQQERFRAFGEMAGGVAHDFNNVLMCVIGYTDLMLAEPKILADTDTALKFLRTMNTAGLDASRIVTRLRDFYRPREENEIFTALDLNTLLKEIVPLTQPKWKTQALATGRNVEICFDVQKLPLISCNGPEVRELLVNLIFNAVDAMPDGGTITLRSRHCGQWVRLGVTDSGTGMTEETKQRCMEPFFSTKGDEGTGLGLSMVFGIVKRHEGQVEIESELGVGTTVWISLPKGQAETEIPDEELFGANGPLRILIVDDEPLARDIVARYLRADGHNVVVAHAGREALARFQEEPFDLVIADQAMPGMTGAQLAAAIAAITPGQPLLLLSGFSDPTLSDEEAPVGVGRVLMKPLSQRALRHAIARLLSGSLTPGTGAPPEREAPGERRELQQIEA
ncbi:MAG: Histidine kinase [Chthoniobacter sp.]|jgi:signal transduction histidine kinase|nr:Histidine kinase [Chthoniobacter sp.]